MTLTESTAKQLIKELKAHRTALQATSKVRWVKVSVITELTGWDRRRLERARNSGEIIYKKDSTGIWYDQDSINSIHLSRKTA
jgi:hypothetical protein